MRKKHFKFLSVLLTASMLASSLPVYAQDRPADTVIEAESEDTGYTDETEASAADEVVDVPEDDGETSGDYEYKLRDDNTTVKITKYKGSGGEVTIPETLDGHTVAEIGGSAFKASEISGLTIPASIISIGTYAFADCKMLQTVTFESGSSDIELDYNTFSN